MEQFNRLNAFGEEVGNPTSKPTSRIGHNNEKQVGILYGHNGGGKVYSYLGGDGLRVGDTVTPEVTHPKSGKDYHTLGRVVSTRDSMGSAAGNTSAALSGQGIMMKTLSSTNQSELTGFKSQKDADPNFTAKQWKANADKQYKDKLMQRLNPMGEVT